MHNNSDLQPARGGQLTLAGSGQWHQLFHSTPENQIKLRGAPHGEDIRYIFQNYSERTYNQDDMKLGDMMA